MFVGITNTPRDYAWGSRTAIAGLLGREPSGQPEAELWLGTHPGSPSVVLDPAAVGGAATLDRVTTLPFLLKVLAAAAPLSLQAHPNLAQAAEGFARENAAGIPLDSPARNYKDAGHKPELVYALSHRYDALCGFRPVAQTRELLERLAPDPLVAEWLDRLVDDSSLPAVFEWLISRGPGVDPLIARLPSLLPPTEFEGETAPRERFDGETVPNGADSLRFGSVADGVGAAGEPVAAEGPGATDAVGAVEFATARSLAESYPGDPGILISLLLNRVVLNRGEVLYLPAGNIHAYLDGLGIELMAASDNVLRGGLTPKHVDVPELISVLDFTPLPVPILGAEHPSANVSVFRPDVPDFVLVVVATQNEGDTAEYAPAGDSIALCVEGFLHIRSETGEYSLGRGDAVYISTDEGPLTFAGVGLLFLAAPNG